MSEEKAIRTGKVISPLREMLSDSKCNCVIFHCEDGYVRHRTRLTVLAARRRNDMDIRTHKDNINKLDLVVMKGKRKDIYRERHNPIEVYISREKHA